MTDAGGSRYDFQEVLGRGAMGVVYRAYDPILDRDVALKELRPSPGIDSVEAVERFLVEAQAAARLSHPNIVRVHDIVGDHDRVLIAMELVEGRTLDTLVEAFGAQPAATVRAIMSQVAHALAEAHAHGIVHRDLKPENVFWTAEERAVVTDFGLARIGAGRGTVAGTVMGTPGYMAPEQVLGQVVGPAVDVFAWGAVAYYLATATPPFGDNGDSDISQLAYRIVHDNPPPLALPEDPGFAALVTRALIKNSDERPANGMVLVDLLTRPGSRPPADGAEVDSGTGPLPATPTAPAPGAQGGSRAARSRRSRMALACTGVAAAVAVIIAVALSNFSTSSISSTAPTGLAQSQTLTRH